MVPTQILLNNFKNLYAQKDRDNAGGAAACTILSMKGLYCEILFVVSVARSMVKNKIDDVSLD